jgi:O-succinylbenzoic acid--CoA ligase
VTRELRAVDGDAVFAALGAALSGGPAIFVGAAPDLPATVPRRVALVVQSSGSTGRPKRVALSADALLASAAASASALGAPGQWLLALPTNYIAGLNVLVRSIAAETTPVAIEGDGFTPARFVAAVARLDPQHPWFTSLVPTQLSRLLEDTDAAAALARFSRVLIGGQATPSALLDRAATLGIRTTRTYGSSETSGGCVYDGEPIGQVAVRVVDGEVHLSGPVLAEGYLGDPERTDATFVTDDGVRWYRTGDAGSIDGGVLRVTGRFDDVIISGGVKVSLGEVERRVRELPGQHEAVVVRMPSDEWGEVPAVVTVVPVGLDRVRDFVTESLGRAAAPARVLVLGEIPLLASGKPDRVALRGIVIETRQ